MTPALVGSLNPPKSGGCEMYLTNTVMLGSMYLAPAVNPASNFLMRSISTPPMNPTFLDLEASAAAAPTRNEPSFSANSREDRFPVAVSSLHASHVERSMNPSTSPNLMFGYLAAPAPMFGAYRKPTPMIRP